MYNYTVTRTPSNKGLQSNYSFKCGVIIN